MPAAGTARRRRLRASIATPPQVHHGSRPGTTSDRMSCRLRLRDRRQRALACTPSAIVEDRRVLDTRQRPPLMRDSLRRRSRRLEGHIASSRACRAGRGLGEIQGALELTCSLVDCAIPGDSRQLRSQDAKRNGVHLRPDDLYHQFGTRAQANVGLHHCPAVGESTSDTRGPYFNRTSRIHDRFVRRHLRVRAPVARARGHADVRSRDSDHRHRDPPAVHRCRIVIVRSAPRESARSVGLCRSCESKVQAVGRNRQPQRRP